MAWKPTLSSRLNPGFSRFDGRVDIVQGALDLAGQQLVAFAVDDNRSQAIDIREGGKLCDSSAGLACTGSRAAPGADQRDRIDAFGLPTLAERFPAEYKPSTKPEAGSWCSSPVQYGRKRTCVKMMLRPLRRRGDCRIHCPQCSDGEPYRKCRRH